MTPLHSPVRTAIVGCGRIGERHATHIARTGRLVAVCDCIGEKATALAAEYGCKAYTSLEEMLRDGLKDLDALAVCTPNGLHKAHSILGLEAGLHVLCEKPMALSASDCRAMMDAAAKADRKLSIVKQNRYNPPVAAVKKALDEGRLGTIQNIQLTCFWNRGAEYYTGSDWKGTLALDGGTLYTQFSHFIDLLYWAFGDVAEVDCRIANFAHHGVIEFEDAGVAMLRFRNGALATVNYSVNSTGRNMEGSLTIIGSRGTVKIGGQYLNELEYQEVEDHVIPVTGESRGANNYGAYTGSMSNHDKTYAEFFGSLESGDESPTNAFEAMKAVEIIERMYRSAGRADIPSTT